MYAIITLSELCIIDCTSTQKLSKICNEQTCRLNTAQKLADSFRVHLRANAQVLAENQLDHYQQTIAELGKITIFEGRSDPRD